MFLGVALVLCDAFFFSAEREDIPMCAEEMELARAAASLTVEDFRYLQEHGMIRAPAVPSNVNTQVINTQEEPGEQEDMKTKKERKRRTVKHKWPEVGQILQADYEGVQHEAEVVAAPRYKSGKALRILNGPAAGEIFHSMTGAMLKATEAQRRESNLGRKGVANGWDFWKVKGKEQAP